MDRRALLLAALLPVAPCLAQRAQSPLYGVAGYDYADLDSLAQRLRVDLRATVARAASRDLGALRVLMLLPDPADSVHLRASRSYPALLWSLLAIWGDRGFANELQQVTPEYQRLVLGALDRASAQPYATRYPRTWSVGDHDSLVLAALRRPLASDTLVESGRIYSPAELHRLPTVDLLSCRPLAYPRELLDAGIAGRVVVELVLDSDGVVAPQTRTVAATHAAFADAAESFVRGCRYAPGRRASRAVPSLLRVDVPFLPESVVVRTGPQASQVLPSRAVQAVAEGAGVPYAEMMVRAGHGDAGALRTVLLLATRFPALDSAAADYTAGVETLLYRFGDRPFAAMAQSIPDSARDRLSELLDFQAEDVARYPLTTRAIPPRQPAAASQVAPDTVGARYADMIDWAPRLRIGTCAAPSVPGLADRRNVTLHARIRVEAIVDTTGHVHQANVRITESPNLIFDPYAKIAAATCRYHPARHHGQLVMARLPQNVDCDYRRAAFTR